jgi:hypothetical protein
LLDELGADVDQATSDGITAFLVATTQGLLDVLRCLVNELGVDVNQAAQFGTPSTALVIAAKFGRLDVVQCLAKELGADVNQATENGTTALTVAAMLGQLDVVKCLVKECGADVNRGGREGITPTMLAALNAEHGMVVVRWLLIADPEDVWVDGLRILSILSAHESTEPIPGLLVPLFAAPIIINITPVCRRRIVADAFNGVFKSYTIN